MNMSAEKEHWIVEHFQGPSLVPSSLCYIALTTWYTACVVLDPISTLRIALLLNSIHRTIHLP